MFEQILKLVENKNFLAFVLLSITLTASGILLLLDIMIPDYIVGVITGTLGFLFAVPTEIKQGDV